MKNILITGVSNTDPFTNIVFEITDENNKENKKTISSQKAFTDGPMISILRKHIKENDPISEIYIYLTKDMSTKKEIYIESIQNLYSYYGLNSNLEIIKFYPNDYYADYENRLRDKDVHKFASYYKEIYYMYSNIKNENSHEEKNIILNISSGTPAFKSDMVIMAVTNNLKIEQTSNITNIEIKNKIKDYCKEEIENETGKIDVKSYPIANFPNDLKDTLINWHTTENNLTSRTQKENFDETKKVMILESIEDSVAKKDYCGIYNTLLDNEKYLGKNKEKLLEISSNLYFRYIGNDQKAKENIKDIKKYYPIYNLKNKDNTFITIDEINFIIEKFNIMKIKSKRDEINDWLLISTPLLETVIEKFITVKCGLDFKMILDENSKISIDKLNERICGAKLKYITKDDLRDLIKDNRNGSFLNASFYKKIIKIMKQKMPNYEREKLEKFLNNIYIIDNARTDRVTAAHSIRNVNIETFTREYESSLKKDKRYIQDAIKPYYKNGNFQSIKFVEDIMKELINDTMKELIQNYNYPINEEKFKCSINIYETLEKEMIELLRKEIY